MFEADNAPIEVGKLRNRFLSDERGRRIYFPPFGLARLVPSRDAEAKLREREFFPGLGVVVLITAAQAVDVYWPDRLPLYALIYGCAALMAALAILSGQFLTRHWEPIPAEDYSYDRGVMAIYARRSFALLILTALAQGVGCIAVTALPVFTAYAVLGMDNAIAEKAYRLVPPLLVVAVFLPFAWLAACRSTRALIARVRSPGR